MIVPKIFNDNWTLEDSIGHKDHVKAVADTIEQCDPPYVLGIHGDWGAGKTSFLRKLHLYFAGEGCGYDGAKDNYTNLFGNKCTGKPDIETIWFDAWHYQFETNPVVALLNEIRAHFALSKSFFDKAEKLSYAAIMSLDDLAKKIGASPSKIMAAGEKWEKDHYAQPLPSQMIKDLMEDAISKLLGKKHRLVIFVDDLDRCTGTVSFKFLEAMKVYFSLANCVFVLGMDVRHVRRAVAAELQNSGIIPKSSDENDFYRAEIYASDYLSKMFQHVFYLPNVSNYRNYLNELMNTELKPYIDIITKYDLLPSNPRKIKTFVSSLTFYVKQLEAEIEKFNKDKESENHMKLDHKLALIMTYLRIMANDVYRILEREHDFWRNLKDFCSREEYKDHWALKKLLLYEKPKISPEDEASETSETIYESIFPDPSDESLFRAAKLIREMAVPEKDELNVYTLRGE